MEFVLTAFSGPGCYAAEGGRFTVGVGNNETKSGLRSSQESEAGYYKVLLRGGGDEVVLEAAASSPRTATVRLNYQSDGLTAFIAPDRLAYISERDDRWVVTYRTGEYTICNRGLTNPDFYVSMHIGKHQVESIRFEDGSDDTRSGKKVEFVLRSDQRAVDVKFSMSYLDEVKDNFPEAASRNIDVENPEWTDFEVEKEKARKAWNYYLSKVAIDEFQDSGHDKTDQWDKWSIFYSALYRSMLHMNTASDVDGNYVGIGKVEKNLRDAPSYGYGWGGPEGPPPKVYFTNFSGWDVYRSQMALVGLMAPALSQDMAISLLESGYVNGRQSYTDQGSTDREIPRWTTGYVESGVMPGDSGPPSVSSLFMFGSRSVSLYSMLDLFDHSSRRARTWTPDAHHQLEGVASDTAIANMALWMSQQDSLPQAMREKARDLYKHALGRTDRALSLLDSQGYAKSKSSLDSGVSDKNAFLPQFSEGNSIQYTFMILNDVLGLKQKIDAGEKLGHCFGA